MLKPFFSILFLIGIVTVKAQIVADSLKDKSFDYLFDRYDSSLEINEQDNYANTIVAKAKLEKDTIKLVAGYHFKSLVSENNNVIVYQDSIISLLKNNSNEYQPAVAYLYKASYYYNLYDYKKMLDNVIEANTLAIKHNNESLILNCEFYVGILLNRIGSYNEALELFRLNYEYWKKDIPNKSETFLSSAFALGIIYVDLKQLDSASYYNNYGYQKSVEFKNAKYENYFRLNEGISQFYQKNFSTALDSLQKSIPKLIEIQDKPNLAIAYFYLAKANKEFDNSNEVIINLKKVDSLFRIYNDLHPKIRESYEILIDFYKEKNDLQNQLTYVNQLMKLDSLLHANKSYLSNNIIKQYDTPKLISEKEHIIETIKNKELKRKNIIIALSILLLTVTLGFCYQWYKRKLSKLRFLKIISEEPNSNNSKKEPLKNLSKEIVESILKALDQFEENKDYLDAEMTIQSLAKNINSNANYLSKVVNYFKQRSFTNYINSLRIDYAINRLKKDKVFRNYTIDAIANDSGFKKPDSFSRAFYKETGMKPSFFIKELKKTKTD
jgi:AraC-like DNA-binding protein